MFPLFAVLLSTLSLADAPLDNAERDIAKLSVQVGGLEAQIVGDAGFMSESEARGRFEDALLAHMVGDHLRAAEGFFLLTQVLTVDALRRDAQWYLAESLTAIGSYQLAEQALLDIDADPDHPFREAASLKLLDIYAVNQREDEFLSYYARAATRISPSDSLTYSLGKSFYNLGHLERAHQLLEDIPPQSGHYGRARYLLGAIHVTEGNLEEAVTHFKDNLAMSIDNATDRNVHDLTVIALARIAYEQEDFAQAAHHYRSVSGDTEYLADQLYEQVWTFVRLEDDQAAMGALELFLLHFPDHPYTGRLQLARGHLQMRQKHWEDATQEYERVLTEYRPLQGAAFQDMPTWMQERIDDLPEVEAAQQIVDDLGDQSALLDDSVALAQDLQKIMAASPVLKRHKQAYIDTASGLRVALVVSMELLRLDTRTLPGQGRDQRTRSNALRKAQGQLLEEIQAVYATPDISLAEARAATTHLLKLRVRVRAQWASLDETRTPSKRRKTEDRIRALTVRVDALIDRLGSAYHDVNDQSDAVKIPLRNRLAQQEQLLQSAIGDHQALSQVGDMVLHTAEAQGVEAMEGFLAGAIRQADMGLADAAWNEFIDIVQQQESTQKEKNEKLLLLESTVEALRGRVR